MLDRNVSREPRRRLQARQCSAHGFTSRPRPVLTSPRGLYPVEIKKTAAPGRDALRGMAALERQGVPLGEGAVICLVPDAIPLSRSVQAVPVGWL